MLSTPTPRLDSEVLNSKGQLISAMLKNEYLGAQNINIHVCDKLISWCSKYLYM